MNKIFVLSILIVLLNNIESYPNIKRNSNKTFTKVISKNGLLLRANHSLNSEKLLLIPYNENVRIINTDGPYEKINSFYAKWVKVNYMNKTGWVYSAYLEDFMKLEEYKFKLPEQWIELHESSLTTFLYFDNDNNKVTLKTIDYLFPERKPEYEYGTFETYKFKDKYYVNIIIRNITSSYLFPQKTDNIYKESTKDLHNIGRFRNGFVLLDYNDSNYSVVYYTQSK